MGWGKGTFQREWRTRSLGQRMYWASWEWKEGLWPNSRRWDGNWYQAKRYAGSRLHRRLQAIVKTADFLLRAMERVWVVLSKGVFHRSMENNGEGWKRCGAPLSWQATNRAGEKLGACTRTAAAARRESMWHVDSSITVSYFSHIKTPLMIYILVCFHSSLRFYWGMLPIFYNQQLRNIHQRITGNKDDNAPGATGSSVLNKEGRKGGCKPFPIICRQRPFLCHAASVARSRMAASGSGWGARGPCPTAMKAACDAHGAPLRTPSIHI